jgi:hypothetical protein
MEKTLKKIKELQDEIAIVSEQDIESEPLKDHIIEANTKKISELQNKIG